MGAEENKVLVRQVTEEAWNKGDIGIVDATYADNHVSHDPSNPQQARGPRGVKEFVARYHAAFPDTHITIEEQLAEGDLVASRWTARGTHQGDLMGIRPTGKQVTVTGTLISRIVGGKIVEEWSHWDALGMMQQLGVAPMPGQAAGTTMQAAIRRYRGIDPGAVDEIVRRAEQEFMPRLTAVPGFVSYALATAGPDQVITASIFEDQAGAEESVRVAAEYVKQNMAMLVPTPPEVARSRVAIREVVDNVQATYGVMRRYRTDPGAVDEIVRRAREGFVPLIRAGRGFVSYIAVDAGQGELISLSAFADRAAAEESTRMAAGWVKDNLATLLPNPPEVTVATIKLRTVKAAVAAQARS